MAKRYNTLGAVKDETVAYIDAAVAARNIPAVRVMTGPQIRDFFYSLQHVSGCNDHWYVRWERIKMVAQ
jgi:hypothetical protein